MTDMLIDENHSNQNSIDPNADTSTTPGDKPLTSNTDEKSSDTNIDQTTTDLPSPLNQVPNHDLEGKIRNLDTANDIVPLLSDMKIIFNKYRQLEALIVSKATVSNDSMKDIFDMLKILSYNQTVLENRLEDALKNQMNTDILVNSINERLNALSMKFQALPTQSSTTVTQQRPLPSEPHHPVTRSLSNDKSKSKSKDNVPITTTTTTASSLPVTKRGPGRPRKHPLPATTTATEPTQRPELVSFVRDKLKTKEEKSKENSNNNSSSTMVSPVYTSLPMNATHIAKSKRYFVNPLNSKVQVTSLRQKLVRKEEEGDSSSSSSNDDDDDTESVSKRSSVVVGNGNNKRTTTTITTTTTSSDESLPRRRGRPPKKRKVETLIINVSNGNNTEVAEVKLEHDDTSTRLTRGQKFETTKSQSELSKTVGTSKEEIEHGTKESNETSLKTAGNVAEDESHQTNTFDSRMSKLQRSTLRSGSDKTADERSMQQSPNSTSVSVSPPQSSPTPGSPTFDSVRIAAEIRKRQKQLDLLRDSREKMLVNMKYNDRERAKSFIESNKKILMAMKEEERRRKMAAIVGTTPNVHLTSNQTATGMSTSNNDATDLPQGSSPVQKETNNNTNNTQSTTTAATTAAAPEQSEEQQLLNTPDSTSQQVQTAVNITNDNSSLPMDNHTAETKQDTKLQPPVSPPTNIGGGRFLRSKTRMASTPKPSNNSDEQILTSGTTSPTGEDINTLPLRPTRDQAFSADVSPLPLTSKSNTPGPTFADFQTSLLLNLDSPIELISKDGFFYRRNMPEVPITAGTYLEYRFLTKERELANKGKDEPSTTSPRGSSRKGRVSKREGEVNKNDRTTVHFLKPRIEKETEQAYSILSRSILTEKFVNSLEYFLLEFRWENRLVGLGLRLKESKRTWQRRKALFALFEFWRDQSREKRNFDNFSILHAVKEMENYRIFINRSASWFYNHITLLKMILYDLCDNTDTQWREWMFPKNCKLPVIDGYTADGELITAYNINRIIDNMLTFDFLGDGSSNVDVKFSKVVAPATGIR